jgi:hypothetical protein
MFTHDFWITPEGTFEMGAHEHVDMALKAMLRLDTETSIPQSWYFGAVPAKVLKEARKRGAPEKDLEYLSRESNDPRTYMIAKYGWIRVARGKLNMQEFNQESLDLIQKAKLFWEIEKPEDHDMLDIDELSGQDVFSVSVKNIRRRGASPEALKNLAKGVGAFRNPEESFDQIVSGLKKEWDRLDDSKIDFKHKGKNYSVIFERWGYGCVERDCEETDFTHLSDGEKLEKYKAAWAKRLKKIGWKPVLVEWEEDESIYPYTHIQTIVVPGPSRPEDRNPEDETIPCGKCFEYALKNATAFPDASVKHGLITEPASRPKKKYWHAWIESFGMVHDWQTAQGARVPVTVELFYELYKPEKIASYEPYEAVARGVREKHFGPWHEEV